MKYLIQYTFDSIPLGSALEYLRGQLLVGHGRITEVSEWFEIDNQCESPSDTEHTIFEIGIDLPDQVVKRYRKTSDDEDIRKIVLANAYDFKVVQSWECGRDLYFEIDITEKRN